MCHSIIEDTCNWIKSDVEYAWRVLKIPEEFFLFLFHFPLESVGCWSEGRSFEVVPCNHETRREEHVKEWLNVNQFFMWKDYPNRKILISPFFSVEWIIPLSSLKLSHMHHLLPLSLSSSPILSNKNFTGEYWSKDYTWKLMWTLITGSFLHSRWRVSC